MKDEIKEFNLSDKIDSYDPITQIVVRGDIKEFIKLLKQLYFIDNKVLFADVIIEIDKLAGEKLK